MRITASNIEELRDQIEKRIEIARQRTTDRLKDKLDEYIDRYVYSYNETWEGRSEYLHDAFMIDYEGYVGDEYIGMGGDSTYIELNDDGYEWMPDVFDHGNAWRGLPLNSLVQIVESGLKESHFGFPAIKPRPFISKFQQYAQKHGTDMFLAECNKLGLNLRKGSINMSARMFV